MKATIIYLWNFLKTRKKFWVAPIGIMIITLTFLMILSLHSISELQPNFGVFSHNK